MSAGNTTRAGRIAVAKMIDAMTIDAVLPTVDRVATDATDVTINLFTATMTVEAIAGRNVTATSMEGRR
jgi:hypothetical protein